MPDPYVAIVPDRHGEGTNALVLTPPTAIRPAFGEGSRARHVAAAREAGIPFAVEELASLALDLDTPADLVALTREIEANRGSARADRQSPGDMSAGPGARASALSVLPVAGLPEVTEGMALGELIAASAELRTATSSSSPRRSSPRPRAGCAASPRRSPAPRRASSPPCSARTRRWSS